ncbi:hypothetical protein PVAND_016088 [Polypedilum vanderplanki]|uniref:Uncharacterized protein n=1 Tax=Polypedilum vanderplanki TaxID=319348 RepID=A0A9J6BEU0_POLVA|nr:hypothetical protein PVAND_016088 [Polypedilum vanderplanki]
MRPLNKKYFQSTLVTTTTTIATTTTSTTRKTTKARKNPATPDTCVLTWKAYDPSINQFDPLNDGVLIGYGPDDSPQYVGQIITQYGKTPARIVVNGTKAPGGYSIYISKQVKGKIGETFYLSIGPNNYFYWINASYDDIITNSVKIKGNVYLYGISRINDTTSKGKEFSTLGITFFDIGTFFYDSEKGNVNSIGKNKAELLVCSSNDDQLSAYEADHDQTACVNEWRYYDTVNDPEAPLKYGIFVGNYYDKSPIYVGRGYQTCWGITPGRIAVNGTKPPAVYSPCDGTEYGDSNTTAQFLVYNSSQTYEWVLMSPSDLGYENEKVNNNNQYIMAVARINLTELDFGDFNQVGVVFLNFNDTRYFNPAKNVSFKRNGKPVEMLICYPN